MIKTDSLPDVILNVVKDRGTELPFTGEYNDFGEQGTYLCRQCGIALFRSHQKFHSSCGWPSFDEEITNRVAHHPDPDGVRTEIVCARCEAHLGHIFKGERLTNKDTRYCVNSLSLDFVDNMNVDDTEEAIFAAGCFWGVEYYFKKLPGVLKTEVGYTGGHKKNPTYHEVCRGNTGHYESIRVLYDPKLVSYEQLAKYFFEIHDATQIDGQGPDHGQQYLSVIFYYNELQKQIALRLIGLLDMKGYKIATKLLPVATFWRAELDHQDYYQRHGKEPYCHQLEKKF